MILKAFYKAICAIFHGDGYKEELIIPVWEFVAVIMVVGVILYWVLCDSSISDSNIF